MTIGERLSSRRELAMLTQEGLGEKAGVSGYTVSRIEGNHVKPRFSTVRKLARALEVSPGELWIGREGQVHETPKAQAPSMPGLPEEGTPGRALLEAARELEERAGETAASVTDVSELLPWAEGLFGSITTLVRIAHELRVGDESEQIWQPNVLRVIALTKEKRDEILPADDRAERLEIDRKFEEIVRRVPA